MTKLFKKALIEASFFNGGYFLSPEYLTLITTFKCNFQCKACSIWKKNDQPELSISDWLKIIDDLKQTLSDNTFVEISGGEPLLREDLVISLIKALKIYYKSVILNSNGLLIDKKIISQLEDCGLDALKISFYGINQDTHNFLRGTEKAYGNALKAIKLLAGSKIKLEIGVLITAKNIDELPELFQYLNKFKNLSIILQPLDESIESAESKDEGTNHLISDLWPSQKQINDFFDSLENNRNLIKNSSSCLEAIKNYYLNPDYTLNYRCFAGQRNLVIYPNGSVGFCFKRNAIGHIENDRLIKILGSKAAREERRAIKNCRKYCRILGCNFSRGLKEIFKNY